MSAAARPIDARVKPQVNCLFGRLRPHFSVRDQIA